MDKVGTYIIPLVTIIIIIFGILKRVPVFDVFLKGAKDGMKSTANIAPSLIGLIVSVNMLKASGFLDIFITIIKPITDYLHFPSDLVPLAILRPVSGSGSIAILDNILANNGVDTFVGRVGSVMMGSTETTFYAIAVYFGSVGIKNTRYTVPAALFADFISMVVAVLSTNIMF